MQVVLIFFFARPSYNADVYKYECTLTLMITSEEPANFNIDEVTTYASLSMGTSPVTESITLLNLK